MPVEEEFEQRYAPHPPGPLQVWVYCRHCRCRIQVRTIPAPEVPFRCFCGSGGTLARFDVFTDEEEIRRFAATFETLYQETKALMRQADLPMPATAMYSAEEMRRLRAGEDIQAERRAKAEEEAESAELGRPGPGRDDLEAFRARSRELTEKVQRASDPLQRHDLLGVVGRYAFEHRALHPEARRLCYQACQRDVAGARDTLREATARHRRGERVTLTFPLFKRYLGLLVEDGQTEQALEVAKHFVALGLPGYEERVRKLEAQLAR